MYGLPAYLHYDKKRGTALRLYMGTGYSTYAFNISDSEEELAVLRNHAILGQIELSYLNDKKSYGVSLGLIKTVGAKYSNYQGVYFTLAIGGFSS